MEMTFEQIRVLGSLIEKEITTPEYYPLTPNSLKAACNQKSNRDPVVAFDQALIQRTLTELRDMGLVWKVGGPGTRVDKYEHRVGDAMGLDRQQIAILCELILRGPQTMGELKNHASRMFPFSHMIQLEAALKKLEEYHTGPLVAQMERRPGQKEPRYTHLFMGMPEPEEEESVIYRPSTSSSTLSQRVEDLTQRVETLEAAFEKFKAQFE